MAGDPAPSPTPAAPPPRPYRWGRIWGWITILLGTAAEIAALVMLVQEGRGIIRAPWEGFLFLVFLGAYFIVMGSGLLRKRSHGLVMFVLIGVLLLANTLVFWLDPTMSPARRWSELGVAVPTLVCVGYFLRRYREFH
jgi:hypothetical protein